MPSKLCNTCKEIKDYELFPKQHTVSTGRGSQCKSCVSKRNKERYQENKEEIIKKTHEYRRKNKEKLLIKWRENYKIWYASNKAKRNAITRKYQASKLNRTPPWLTEEQRSQMQKFYVKAMELSTELGVKYVVDHIVPLQGKNVSGLHVPWNLQIIERSENCSKNNKHTP